MKDSTNKYRNLIYFSPLSIRTTCSWERSEGEEKEGGEVRKKEERKEERKERRKTILFLSFKGGEIMSGDLGRREKEDRINKKILLNINIHIYSFYYL